MGRAPGSAVCTSLRIVYGQGRSRRVLLDRSGTTLHLNPTFGAVNVAPCPTAVPPSFEEGCGHWGGRSHRLVSIGPERESRHPATCEAEGDSCVGLLVARGISITVRSNTTWGGLLVRVGGSAFASVSARASEMDGRGGGAISPIPGLLGKMARNLARPARFGRTPVDSL